MSVCLPVQLLNHLPDLNKRLYERNATEYIQTLHFVFPKISNKNMADVCFCKGGSYSVAVATGLEARGKTPRCQVWDLRSKAQFLQNGTFTRPIFPSSLLFARLGVNSN
jgi:hypothetical protein